MEQNRIAQFRANLLQRKQEILDLEATLAERSGTVELDQARVGRVSRMDAMQGQQMALEATRRRQQQLIEIEQALGRIDRDEYGYCLDCGEEIDIRRLEFNPAASLCIRCAE